MTKAKEAPDLSKLEQVVEGVVDSGVRTEGEAPATESVPVGGNEPGVLPPSAQ